jgi:hypothetical protein
MFQDWGYILIRIQNDFANVVKLLKRSVFQHFIRRLFQIL